VEDKAMLMKKLGKKQLTLELREPLSALPAVLAERKVKLSANGLALEYLFDGTTEDTGIPNLLKQVDELGIAYKDLNTHQSSLEDIFVSLVSDRS
jgi:ABC-2 type transport system ATP-binding protein